jgi:hypothetical protein
MSTRSGCSSERPRCCTVLAVHGGGGGPPAATVAEIGNRLREVSAWAMAADKGCMVRKRLLAAHPDGELRGRVWRRADSRVPWAIGGDPLRLTADAAVPRSSRAR